MEKEIGGYFGMEQFSGKEYHIDLIPVNSGRNALLYILKARCVKKLYIPRFLCDSVSLLCQREGYSFEEYAIGDDFLPIFDRTLSPGEYIYIVNYYGQITNDQVYQMKKRWENIIFDNVQAFFQHPVPGVDTVYSCRKFFGVSDGGYVACDARLAEPLNTDCSRDRMEHILGRYETSGSAYYAVFQENDERFYQMPLKEMSHLTRNILRAVDYDWVRRRRNCNYAVLETALGNLNGLKLQIPDGPYAYPFYCPNGVAVRKALAQKKIYVATLWPNVLEHEGTLEKDYAQNILPLPCDQRYTTEDMQRMIEEILNHLPNRKVTY